MIQRDHTKLKLYEKYMSSVVQRVGGASDRSVQ